MRKLQPAFILGLFAILATAIAHIILGDLFPELGIPLFLTLMYPLSVLILLYGVYLSAKKHTPERVRSSRNKTF